MFLDLGEGSVHVRNQGFLCLVQKMYQLVETVVTKYLNVEFIDVHSVVTEVLVKHPYLCETKCVKMRDCQKHQCRRKVCVFTLETSDLKTVLNFSILDPQ
ncbi:hypothetical protein H8959_000027 [Pygathrix nigripes]